MSGERELFIKKNPYMALSPNLIEYFAIIGYKENFVPKILDSYFKKKNPYKPIVLSAITSKSDFGLVDNKLIISQVYPENPLTIFVEKNNPIIISPPSSNVIYSFCFDSQDGKEKIFYICYAFKFYEKYSHQTKNNSYEEYYIPKAFCIISQYYYFTTFEYICRNIYNLIGDINNLIPLEIIVYNIVNYIPSPIYHSMQLDLFGNILNDESRLLMQMSGYPYLEFELSEIFNLLPFNLVLEIYLLTFLELSIIFFCSDLELLNIVMFILFALNYPCNDSPYYWHVVSVSENNFVGENQFVGKFMVSFVGVNRSYYNEFNSSPFGKFHYIVDIDNKKCFLINTEDLDDNKEIEEFQNLKNIQIYIQNILKENKVQSSFLKKIIINLKKKLEIILTKNPDFNLSPKTKYVNFFNFSNTIMHTNRDIQEAFYEFNLGILMILFQDYTLNNSFHEIKKEELNISSKKISKLINSEENIEITKEENIFLKMYRSSSKYGLYFENFIRNFETVDVFSLALLFSEEFINERIKLLKTENKNNISLFKIMDLFFLTERNQTISVTLNNIFAFYEEKFQKYFKNFNKISSPNKQKNKKLFTFNKNILNRFIYLLNNNFDEEEISEIFPYLRLQLNRTMISIKRKEVINSIMQYFENIDDAISSSDLLIFSCVYLFIISISLHPYKRMINYINDIIKSLKYADIFIRYHIFIIIKTFYEYHLKHDINNYSSTKMYMFMLINFIKDNLIIPNEEMLGLLNLYFKDEEKTKIVANIDEKKEDNYISFEKDKNDILYFLRYCFTNKKMFKPYNMVNVAMNEYNVCNIIVRNEIKSLQPLIVLKIKEYSFSSRFYSPKKIYKLTKALYHEFFEKNELNINKLNIIKVRECITNLILYGTVLNNNKKGIIPLDLLINTLYSLKDFNKELEKDDKNKIIKEDKGDNEVLNDENNDTIK